MQIRLGKSFYAASTALTLSLAGFAAQAQPVLPVGSNLSFTQITGTPKETFGSAMPQGWIGGGSGYISIDGTTPGQDAASNGAGGTLLTYGDPMGVIPGNYVQADGNPIYEDSFSRQLTGLTAGQTYQLSFYQGASQQDSPSFTAATTNQWIVSLAANPITTNCIGGGGTGSCTYTNGVGGGTLTQSPLMSVPGKGTVGWTGVTVDLTPTGTTQLLSFLAWGDSGSTANQPPIAFLAGVNEVPEPASMALLGVGLVGLGAISRRRRGKRSTAA